MGTIAASVIIGQALPAGDVQALELIRTAAGAAIYRKDRIKRDKSGCMVDAAMSRRMTWALSLQA